MIYLVICGCCAPPLGAVCVYLYLFKIPKIQEEREKFKSLYHDKTKDNLLLEKSYYRLDKKYRELISAATSLKLQCYTLTRLHDFWVKEADAGRATLIHLQPEQLDDLYNAVEDLPNSDDLLTCISTAKQSWGEYVMHQVDRALKGYDGDYIFLYYEIRKKFSLPYIRTRAEKIRSKRLAAKEAEFKKDGLRFGYVYVMTNASMPGLVKIGCSNNPLLRAVELTLGQNVRKTVDYRNARRANGLKMTESEEGDCPTLLGKYLKGINMMLKTSLPCPFEVQFWIESDECEVDEWFVHEVLREFWLWRGAGTEFFVLGVDEVREAFKEIFPGRAIGEPSREMPAGKARVIKGRPY